MSFAILGMGTALPPTRLSKSDAERVARAMCCSTPEHAELVAALYRQAGIDSRHILFDEAVVRDVLDGTRHTNSPYLPAGADNPGPPTGVRMKTYEEYALPLALRAAEAAFADARMDAKAITHIVTVSCTGFAAPGVDVGLIQRLGLRPTTERTHVGFMGCHGALNGLRVARALSDADPAARVLLCAVELCSLHYHYGWNPKRMVANALFADGAAAVIGGQAKDEDRWRCCRHRLMFVPGQRIRHDLARGRSRFRHDALDPSTEFDRRQPSAVAGGLARPKPLAAERRGLVGSPPRRPARADGRGKRSRTDAGNDGRVPGGPWRVRQHVVADGAVLARKAPQTERTAAVRGAGLRPRPGCRSGAIH